MREHTMGPWKVVQVYWRGELGDTYWDVVDENEDDVLGGLPDKELALLIAAAPDLLEACIRCVDVMALEPSLTCFLEAAITKAEGKEA